MNERIASLQHVHSAFRVNARVGDGIHGIVSPEEQGTRVVLKIGSFDCFIRLELLTVSVMPWEDTLKWTGTARSSCLCNNSNAKAAERRTASGPVKLSVSTEHRKVTLQAKREIQ